MSNNNFYNPNVAIHPGVTLEELLVVYEMSQIDLSKRTGLTPKTINEIIKGKNPITPETAIKFSSVFGMSDTFWNNLEKNYRTAVARIKEDKIIEKNTKLLKHFFCYSELAKHGYVNNTRKPKEKVVNLQKFFGLSDLSYVYDVMHIAFRKVGNSSDINYESLAAWLRCGEIDSKKIETKPFDKNKLTELLPEFRKMTRLRPEIFSEKLVEICASVGISLVYTPYFKNTYVNAATRWIEKDKAIIQLNLRGSYSDIFWFSFFHELAHLIKHQKKDQFIEFNKKELRRDGKKEAEADKFSANTLIPKDEYDNFFKEENYTGPSVRLFAKKIGVSPGIIAGRLSKDLNNWSKFEYLRKKLVFAS